MDILTEAEVAQVMGQSRLAAKYNQVIDSESAYEMLNEKLETAVKASVDNGGEKPAGRQGARKKEESWIDNPMVRQAGRTAASILTRSLLGVLGLSSTRRRKSLF